MFTAPTAMRAIRREDPEGKLARKFGIEKVVKALFLAGERSDPSTIDYCQGVIGEGAKVVDNYWSTESEPRIRIGFIIQFTHKNKHFSFTNGTTPSRLPH